MDFKKISELFTVAVPLLILCSCIRLVTYYGHWNIPILDYLSIPEVLFLFIQPAITIVAFAAILSMLYGIFFAALMRWIPKKKNPLATTGEAPEGPPEELKTPAANEKKKYALLGIIAAVFTFGNMAWFFVQGIWFDFDILPTVLLHLLIGIVAIGVIKKLTEPERETPSLQTVLAGTMIILASASFFMARYEANSTATQPIPHKLLISDGSTIETNTDVIYLGKTSGYYFLYESAAARALIIPIGEVKKIEIGR